MENFSVFGSELPKDDDESKAEKKAKKDAKEVFKKAPLLELLQGGKTEAGKPKETTELFGKIPELEVAKSEQKETGDDANEELDETAEELDETEQLVVSEQLVDDRLEQVEGELKEAPPGSDEEVEAVAAATFLEKLGAKLSEGEAITDEALDEATAETADELGVPPEALDADEDEAPEDEPDDALPTGTTPPPPPPTPPSPTPTPTNPSGFPGSSATRGLVGVAGFGTTPFGGGTTPNTTPAAPNVVKDSSQESGHSHLKYVLAGGLLGYLLGRRRGRIKTEKKLLPVQKKLETQVSDLQEKLLLKEGAIRRIAVRNREALDSINREKAVGVISRERGKRAESLKVYEQGAHSRPEKLGKFALLPNASPERPASSENMSDKRILEVAKNIHVGNTTLEALFIAGRVEQKDLIEIVGKYLSGNSYETLLTTRIKPEHFEIKPFQQATGLPGADKLAQMLPEIPGIRPQENLQFSKPKETHIATRVGMVAATVTVVVVIAALLALWMLGAV